MAISSSTSFPVSAIKLREVKARSSLGDLTDLTTSIKNVGLIHPVIIDRDGTLWAGERRYQVHVNLGIPSIEVRYLDDLSELEKMALEVDENIRREEMPWQDVCRTVKRYHEKAIATFGQWSQDKTADTIGQSRAQVAKLLIVAERLDDMRVGGAATLQTAAQQAMRLNDLAREQETQAIVSAIFEAPKPKTHEDIGTAAEHPSATASRPKADDIAAQHILTASFLDWAPKYSGAPFNLLHCDFPYGIDFQDSEQGGKGSRGLYEDGPEVYFALLDCLLRNRQRLLSNNAVCIFWYSRKFYDQTRSAFTGAGAQVWHNDLIWHKTDNKGIVSDVSRYPRHVYETAMLVRFGDPKVAKVKADIYGAPTVREPNAHASEKPQPMLQHFFEMYVDEYTRMLDPTCGSGSSVRAALALGAGSALGLELDPQYAEVSRGRLADQLRKARLTEGLTL